MCSGSLLQVCRKARSHHGGDLVSMGYIRSMLAGSKCSVAYALKLQIDGLCRKLLIPEEFHKRMLDSTDL